MHPFTLYHNRKIITISSDSELNPVIRLCSIQNQLYLLDNKCQLYKSNFPPDADRIHLEKWKSNIFDIELYNDVLYLVNEKGVVLYKNLNEQNDSNDGGNNFDDSWGEIIIDDNEKKVDSNEIIKNSTEAIKRIKCNSAGKLFVTKNNEMYGCGMCGDVLTTDKPIKLNLFENLEILDVSAGEKFFVILASEKLENCKSTLINNNESSIESTSSYGLNISADKLNVTTAKGSENELGMEDLISLNSFCKTSISSEDLENNLKLIIDNGRKLITTKVYSFGMKNDGLLGTGDHIKRSGINVLSSLSERGVCSIASGREHSLAKTIDGKLYLWGLNSQGQIDGSNERIDFSAPSELKLEDTACVDFNILEACCGDFSTAILDTGLKLFQKGQNTIEKDFILHSVVFDKDIPLIIVSQNFVLQNHQNFAENFSKFLKFFQTNMRNLIQNRFNVINLKVFVEKSNIMHVQKLCCRYLDIVNILAASLQSVEQFFRNNITFWDLQFIKYTSEMIKIYELYTQVYCDVISVNSITEIQKMQHSNESDSKTIEINEKTFTQPFSNIFEIIKFIMELMKTNTEYNDILNEKLMQWDVLLRTNRIDVEIADQTKDFWLKNSKLINLKEIHRRVILDSSKLNLRLSNNSKFTTNTFILFSDFLLQIGAQTFEYDLMALWVKIENETSLRCITPEKIFILTAKCHEDKMIWYQELENSIKLALGKSINEKLSDFRYIKYTYSEKHQKYPGAICKGRWKNGVMHGIFSIKFPDGKIYNGNVKNGEIEGYGKMILSSNATYEGYFKYGKFCGYGILEIPGKRYEGNFHDGLFYGHGELITNSYTYIGEFVANVPSGYGVHEMVEFGDKYMGLFSENKRSGVGVYMTVDDEYFEGIFVDDELCGEGIAIFENGNYYEGEMIKTGPNGKGFFYMPNHCTHGKMNNENKDGILFVKGNIISGNLSGEWEEIKIQTGSVLINQEFPALPNSVGEFIVNNDRKWRSLFDNWENHVFGAITTNNVKTVWNKIVAYSTNVREIEKMKSNLNTESFFARNITLKSNSSELFSKLKNPKIVSHLNKKCNSTLEINSVCKQTSSYETLIKKQNDFDRNSVNSCSYFDFSLLRSDNCGNSSTASRSSSYGSSINNNISFLDYIPNVSIDSLMQNDVDTIRSYLQEAFRDPFHPLYLLNQRISHCFCKSYGCWKIRPPLMLARQAVLEWESLVLRTYKIVRKMFPTLPEEPSYVEGSSEVISHINLLYPILLSEKIYSVILVLYARKHIQKDEIYRQRIIICDKKSDSSLAEILCPDISKTFLTIIEDSHFNEAISTLKQIEINFCPQGMLNVIENSIKLIKEAHSYSNNDSSDSINLSADYMIPLSIFLVLRAGVIQLGAELALLEDLLGGTLNGLGYANYCYTTIKAAYEHIISDNFFDQHKIPE